MQGEIDWKNLTITVKFESLLEMLTALKDTNAPSLHIEDDDGNELLHVEKKGEEE